MTKLRPRIAVQSRAAGGNDDPNPRDPPNGSSCLFAAGPPRTPRPPQPRDDGSHRSPNMIYAARMGPSPPDPNNPWPRDPGNGRQYALAPQPRDDGKSRQNSQPKNPQPKGPTPRDPGSKKRVAREPQPRDPGP